MSIHPTCRSRRGVGSSVTLAGTNPQRTSAGTLKVPVGFKKKWKKGGLGKDHAGPGWRMGIPLRNIDAALQERKTVKPIIATPIALPTYAELVRFLPSLHRLVDVTGLVTLEPNEVDLIRALGFDAHSGLWRVPPIPLTSWWGIRC